MDVPCIVFVDGSEAATECLFAAVPRVGETISMPGDEVRLEVTHVHHFARRSLNDEATQRVQISAVQSGGR
jgi:hypothetical protein